MASAEWGDAALARADPRPPTPARRSQWSRALEGRGLGQASRALRAQTWQDPRKAARWAFRLLGQNPSRKRLPRPHQNLRAPCPTLPALPSLAARVCPPAGEATLSRGLGEVSAEALRPPALPLGQSLAPLLFPGISRVRVSHGDQLSHPGPDQTETQSQQGWETAGLVWSKVTLSQAARV